MSEMPTSSSSRRPDVYFTADTHFGHGNIVLYVNRPLVVGKDLEEWERRGRIWNIDRNDTNRWRVSDESIQHMDDEMIAGVNDTVGEDDILFHVGDFAMPRGRSYQEACQEYRRRIRCRNVHLILGNHDRNNRIGHLFASMGRSRTTRVEDVLCYLHHYEQGDSHYLRDSGVHLYGHAHSKSEDRLDRQYPGRRSLDVGVDNAYRLLGRFRPFAFHEILDILRGRGASI